METIPKFEAPAFKSYRILMTLNASGNDGYFAVDEWKMYEDEEGMGASIFSGGAASASSVTGSSVAANAFDNNESTYWESQSTPGSKWLRYDLPAAVVVRAFYLSQKALVGERPQNFELQGSNDGENWFSLAAFIGFFSGSETSKKTSLVRNLQGTSITSDGEPNQNVFIYDWKTGAFIASVAINSQGKWSFNLPTSDPVLVVHKPPAGFKPASDGPIHVAKLW